MNGEVVVDERCGAHAVAKDQVIYISDPSWGYGQADVSVSNILIYKQSDFWTPTTYVVTEEACSDWTFIGTAAECEAAANSLGITWNSCCQNTNNLPYGCLKRSDNDIIWNGNAGTPNQFPCSVAGNCDHGMRWAVCYDIDDSVSEAQEKCCVDGWSQGTDCQNG